MKTSKIIFIIGLMAILFASVAMAGTSVSVCVPLFGIPGTYVASTGYEVDGIPVYCPPPPPPRVYYHRHYHRLPPPPSRHFGGHRPSPPPPPHGHHRHKFGR